MSKHKINVGDRVKLTGKFLKNTGQLTGGEGLSTWVVTGFSGSWAITNQELSNTSWFTPDELASDPTLRFRRIAVSNLYKVGTLTTENCP